MFDSDFDAFESAFKRLSGVYAWKGKPSEMHARMREYFDGLRVAPLADVLTAAQTCRDTLKHFPKIVEWRAKLPTPDTAKPAAARWMGHDEALEYVRAERHCWHTDPCSCLACQAAGVEDRPLRYVPEFDRDDHEIEVWCGLKHEMVVAGHWAHGDELARWYAGHARWLAAFAALKPYAKVLTFIGAEREPGEEG